MNRFDYGMMWFSTAAVTITGMIMSGSGAYLWFMAIPVILQLTEPRE